MIEHVLTFFLMTELNESLSISLTKIGGLGYP